MKLENLILEMKEIGDLLVPYNWPKADPKLEDDINHLKARNVEVDGYTVLLHLNRADYDDYDVETLQIVGDKTPFLPFSLVMKLGRKFLGDSHLQLIEFFKDTRKLYCWTVYLDKRGRPMPAARKQMADECVYDGFKYLYLQPSQVNFY